MKLRKVNIRNIKCFESLEYDFSAGPISPVIFSGDNSSGKSTFLRCIALGLCDAASASALLLELPGEFIRKNDENKGAITIEFSIDSDRYRMKTTFVSLGPLETVTQELSKGRNLSWTNVKSEDFPWDKIFTAGYGAGIRNRGTADYDAFSTVDALYPLFKYDHPLQQPELVLRRFAELQRKFYPQRSQGQILRPYFKILHKALGLASTVKISLTSTGIEITSSDGRKIPLGAHGDGYRSIINLFLDIMSWWYLYKRMKQRKTEVQASRIRGLILIDEIEQHLHPQWQLTIIGKFSDAFPNIQLVVATHSPLVISGFPKSTVVKLESGVHLPAGRDVYGWEAVDVYREIMGLPITRALLIQDKIDRYRELFMISVSASLDNAQKLELKRLEKEIRKATPAIDATVTIARMEGLKSGIEERRNNLK